MELENKAADALSRRDEIEKEPSIHLANGIPTTDRLRILELLGSCKFC